MEEPLFQEENFYHQEIHGSLDKYLKEYDGFNASPLFKGIKQFEMLKKKKLSYSRS